MCVVSMVGDYYSQKWAGGAGQGQGQNTFILSPPISREEFDALKKEVLEMKELLLRAKEYDGKNNQPDCENAKKLEILQKVAELVGVDLSDILKPKT